MTKILYSMCGEGRGHATRVRAVVEMLRGACDFVLYAPGDAFDVLDPLYAESDIRVERIEGLRYYYNSANNNVDYLQTGYQAARYFMELRKLVDRLCLSIAQETPDLVITDFEPALPRAARRCGVPVLSLDHQHFLMVSDFSDMPADIRFYVAVMKSFMKTVPIEAEQHIVSSFFFPKLLTRYRRVKQIGVLLRSEILSANPVIKDHLIAYFRREVTPQIIEELRALGVPVHIYGTGNLGRVENLWFKNMGNRAFVEDLATSRGLVCTAGNQLVGEALHLNKPVLALPEPGNYEQLLNGLHVEKIGVGMCKHFHETDCRVLREFLDNIDRYREAIVPERFNGNREVIRTIGSFLGSTPNNRRSSEVA